MLVQQPGTSWGGLKGPEPLERRLGLHSQQCSVVSVRAVYVASSVS